MINVLIEYEQEKTFFECDKNVTIRSVLKKYTSIKNLDYDHFFGLNYGDNVAANKIKRLKLKNKIKQDELKLGIIQINADISDFDRTESNVTTESMLAEADEKDFDKIKEIKDPNKINKLNQILNRQLNLDKEDNSDDEEEIDEENKNLDPMLDYILDLEMNADQENNEGLIQNKEIIPQKDKTYKNFFKLYSILFIQYIFIFLVRLLGAIFGLNDIFNNNKKLEVVLFVSTALILSILSIVINFIPNVKLKRKILFLYHFVYAICLIIISFLLSIYINSIIIVISLGLIALDALSMGIYVFIVHFYQIKYKKNGKPFSFNIYGYLLCPFISNLIIIIILHFSLVKNIYNTLYISIAGLLFIISHFIFSYLFTKFYKNKGYIFHSLAISLSIYSLIGFAIKKSYKYIKPTFEQYHGTNIKPFLFKIYSILLVEFFLILMTFLIGFHFQWHMFFINHKEVIFISVTIVVYIMLIIFFQEKVLIIFFYIFYVISIIAIIFYGFLLSNILDTNVILSLFTLILLDIFSIEIYILFYKEYNKWGMVLSPIIAYIITTPFMYIFWVKNYPISYILFIAAIVIILLNLFIHTLLFAYLTIDYNEKYILTVMIIKLSLLTFLQSIIFCCTDAYDKKHFFQNEDDNDNENNGNAHNANDDNDDNDKLKYLLKVNIYILIYIIIYIILFYIYKAKGIPKNADNIMPFLGLCCMVVGIPDIYVMKAMFTKGQGERKDISIIFAFLNIFILGPNFFIFAILFSIYEFIYILWILFSLILTIIIYTSISKRLSYFLFVFYPLATFLAIYYIIYNFCLADKSHKSLIIYCPLGAFFYIIIIEIVLLCKTNVGYNEIFYSLAVINYFIYIPCGLYMILAISIYYYLFFRCCCSDNCRRTMDNFLCFCCNS